MKNISIISIIILSIFCISCASLPEAPKVEPLNIKLPAPPPNYIEMIRKIKQELGRAQTPTIIKQNGITYFGFTKEQMVQFRLLNEAFKQLEEVIISQQKQANIYFIEIKTLKKLAETKNAQAKEYSELYNATRDAVKKAKLEALGYKILTFGAVIAIIALGM